MLTTLYDYATLKPKTEGGKPDKSFASAELFCFIKIRKKKEKTEDTI